MHDIVILGGGSGGYACALRASQLGLSVVLIEKDKLGGTCLHRGCIPTKALLHAAEVADTAREGENFGVHSTFNGIDMTKVNEYKDGVIGRLYKGLQGLVKSRDITYVEGTGTLVAPNVIEVNGERYEGKNIVLATGSFARTLPGLDITGRIMTSDQALTIDYVPASVIILGGGVIGVEFASVWRSFGVDVTVVEGLPNLVPAEDAAVSKAMERAFRKRGIDFKVGVRFQNAVQDAEGVTVTLESGDTLRADLLLVAVGRGIFVAEEIAGLAPQSIDESGIPRVTYSEPEIASIGYTEAQAKEKYGDIESYEYNLGGNGKSQILGTTGFIKLIRQKDGPVVGVHMIGSRVGELIGEAQLIYNWEAYPSEVANLVHAHPTQNEAMGEAHLALAGKPLHAHA
ncbi:MAG: dihydrolipoyl dehydrogenase [Actinobacteria bacterium]|nr:dihydrolipoyl dehydrogenase [Actinomycetota bacterium]